jgi:hypothetical protein
MVNEYGKNAALKAHVDKGMEAGNAALAAYVSVDVAKRLRAGTKFTPALVSWYANIFEPQSVANTEFTPEIFEAFVKRIEQQFPGNIDPMTPAIWSRVAEAGPSGKAINLGNFNKTANTFSVGIWISGQNGLNIYNASTTLSYVMVKKRMLYITIFKQVKKDTDLQSLLDLTRMWTAAIVEANR